MIGFVDNMLDGKKGVAIPTFENISYIDTKPIFEQARHTIEYLLPEFIKYIGGNRSRARLYGNIKKFYPEEAVYLYRKVLDHNINTLKDVDYIVEESCSLYPELRIIIVKEGLRLENIAGYDIISFTKNGKHYNTVVISDCGINDRIIFNMCLKLFDSIIMGYLSEYNIPITAEKYIALNYNGINSTVICKFIIDYIVELLYPFDAKIKLEKNEIEDIIATIFVSNFQILSSELIHKIYDYVHGTINGTHDEYDYIALIIHLEDDLDKVGIIRTDQFDFDEDDE